MTWSRIGSLRRGPCNRGAVCAGPVQLGRTRTSLPSHSSARKRRHTTPFEQLPAVVRIVRQGHIGWPGGPFAPREELPSVEQLAAGFRQLVERAHLRGVRVIGATLTPFEDALRGTPLEGHYSPAKEATRQALNTWIREAGVFDAVVDFDRLLRDESRPSRLRAEFDSGDHLHPGDAGYQAMAEAVDLKALLDWSERAR